MSPVVKICGLRRADDARLAASLGANWLGIVLAADSPRRATREEAILIAAAAGGQARPVLVFRDAAVGEIVAAVRYTGIATVQPHGVLTSSICNGASPSLRKWKTW